MSLTVGSLFTGIGGIDLAFTVADFKVVWQVEIDEFCRTVLAKHWPDAERHADIFECRDLPFVDVIVAGFPCQPFSVAGQRKGNAVVPAQVYPLALSISEWLRGTTL